VSRLATNDDGDVKVPIAPCLPPSARQMLILDASGTYAYLDFLDLARRAKVPWDPLTDRAPTAPVTHHRY